ncbi:MAG: 50S ribosomal protein L23 [Proteobacteria bacterium]|nr:50S ribosomal protein L23 [Pseudomonadota bacterium]
MHPLSVIIRPVLSEKSNQVREAEGKYTFIVQKDATKDDVKKAVAALWNVKVEKVSTLIQRGKFKRRGAHYSKPSLIKKAVVTLVEGAKLPIFEDQ